jgi:hypothetical protein
MCVQQATGTETCLRWAVTIAAATVTAAAATAVASSTVAAASPAAALCLGGSQSSCSGGVPRPPLGHHAQSNRGAPAAR